MRAAIVALVGLFSLTGKAQDLKVPLRPVTSVSVGRHMILPLPTGVKSATVGDPRIASAQVLSDSEVLVAGNARGRTTVAIRSTGGAETVYELSVETTPPVAQAHPAETIAVGVGYQKSFLAPDVKRVAVGDPKIADVSVIDGKEILLTGVAPGRTSLLVWRGNDVHLSYAVKVEEKPMEEVLKEIRELLGPMEGVRLRIIGDRIFLDGEVEAPEDGILIKKVCGLYPNELVCW